MTLFVLLLAACGSHQIVVSPGFDGCVDYDPDDQPVEELRVEEDGTDFIIFHDGVFRPSDAMFDPEIGLEGKTLEVREYWTEGAEDDFCFRAFITLKDPEPGSYEVHWYMGDN